MISSAQDYMFVTFGAGIEVDGAIMPKRADKSILRGVDVGFLLEAREERIVAAGRRRSSPLEFNGKLSSDWLRSVASSYDSLVGLSYQRGLFVKQVPLNARLAASGSPISDYGMEFPVSDLESNKAAFATGSRLDMEAVLDLFTDTQRLRTFLMAGPVYTSEWQTWTMAAQGDVSVVSGYGTGYLYAWASVYKRNNKVATGIKNVAGGALTFKVPASDLVDRCTVLLLARATRDPADIIDSQTRDCWIPLEATRSGDSFTVGAQYLSAAASTAMQVTGLDTPSHPTASTFSNAALLTVRAVNAVAVCTLTDHTNQE